MPLPAGTKLGPYQIQSPLGAGGMGEVYKAKDTRLDRTVAIKILAAGLSSSPEIKQRFEREARTCFLAESPAHLPAVRCRLARRHRISGDGISGGRDAG
jgi:serine/threonine protein kinase